MTDNCDTCKELDVKCKSLQATKKRLVESGSVQRNEIHQIETNIKTEKKVHKEDTFKAHQFHHTMIERCRSVWKKIAEFEQKSTLSEADTDQLEALKHQFTLVLSAISKRSFFHIGGVQPSQAKRTISRKFHMTSLELLITALIKIQSIC